MVFVSPHLTVKQIVNVGCADRWRARDRQQELSIALQDGDHEVKESFSDLHLEQHLFLLHLEDKVYGAVVVRLKFVLLLVMNETFLLQRDE